MGMRCQVANLILIEYLHVHVVVVVISSIATKIKEPEVTQLFHNFSHYAYSNSLIAGSHVHNPFQLMLTKVVEQPLLLSRLHQVRHREKES